MELTTLQPEARAAIAMESTATEQYLLSLSEQHTGITEAKDKAGRDQAHRAAMQLMQARLAVEKTATDAKDDAKRFVAGINAECARLVGIVKPEELRLKGVRDEWDIEQARIKEAEAEAKRARIEAMNQRIAAIRDIGNRAMRCATSEQAQAIASNLGLVNFDGMDEFEADAQYAHGEATATCAAVIERLQAAEQTARELEQQRRELAAAKAEIERMRQEQAQQEALSEPSAPDDSDMQQIHQANSEAAYATLVFGGHQRIEPPAAQPEETAPVEAQEPDSRTVSIRRINALIAPLGITADGLETLGFLAIAPETNSRRYQRTDLPRILDAMKRHIKGVGMAQAA